MLRRSVIAAGIAALAALCVARASAFDLQPIMGANTPVLDLDFRGMASLDPRITFTRASAVQDWPCTSSPLALTSVGSGSADLIACDFYGGIGSPLGWGMWRSSNVQQKFSRDLTNAAWTATSATVVKDQTGLDGTANSASSITATGANATVLQSLTAGNPTRMLNAYVKRITGTGAVYMTMDGDTTRQQIDADINSTTWTIVPKQQLDPCDVGLVQAVTNPNFGFKLATSGDKIAVDQVQLGSGNSTGCPLPPFTTTSSINVGAAQDTATMLLNTIPGLNVDSWTAVVRFLVPFGETTTGTCYSAGTNCAPSDGVFQIDDGSTLNGVLARIQWGQHYIGGTGDDDVNAQIVVANAGQGKVRCATDANNPLSSLIEIRPAKQINMAISYDRVRGIAIACQHNGIGPADSITSTQGGLTAGQLTRLSFGGGLGGIASGAMNGWYGRFTIYNGYRVGAALNQVLMVRQ